MFDFIEALDQTTTMLSTRQLAEMLQVGEQSIRRMVSKRTIPSVLIGGQRRFDPKTLHWWYVKRSPAAVKARL